MKIVLFRKNLALDPAELQILIEAYDTALLTLRMPDSVLREKLAAAIFDIAKLGERNSEVMSKKAIQKLIELRNVQPSQRIVERVTEANFQYSGC